MSLRATLYIVTSSHHQPCHLEPLPTLSPRAESRGSYYFIWYRFKTCSIARKLKNNVGLSPRTTTNPVNSNHNQPLQLEPPLTLSPRAESRGSYYFIWYRFKTCSIARKLKNNVGLSPRTTTNPVTSSHHLHCHLERSREAATISFGIDSKLAPLPVN